MCIRDSGRRIGGLRHGRGRPFQPRRRGLVRLLAVCKDFRDAQEREFLPMAALAAGIFSPPLLERDDLGAARLIEHLGRNRGAGDGRRAKRHTVAADDQDLAEFDDLTRLALDLVDLEHIFGGDPVLPVSYTHLDVYKRQAS